MKDGYTTFDLTWQGRIVVVSYQANWLNGGQWHIELRCDELLPVPDTGYRTQFTAAAELETAEDIASYVVDWLDEAAKDPRWPEREAASRQLKLF